MALGDPGEALRAKAELARRHAQELREQASGQRELAVEQRELEERALEAARGRLELEGPVVRCLRCNAEWRSEAIAEAVRREPRCLLCGGALAPVP